MGQAQQNRRAVLIVEDDAELREFVARLLEDGELDTIECESAEAALATMLIRGRDVAMIFADIRLPGVMDGIDLAREVTVPVKSLYQTDAIGLKTTLVSSRTDGDRRESRRASPDRIHRESRNEPLATHAVKPHQVGAYTSSDNVALILTLAREGLGVDPKARLVHAS